jgi:hypothetical protein
MSVDGRLGKATSGIGRGQRLFSSAGCDVLRDISSRPPSHTVACDGYETHPWCPLFSYGRFRGREKDQSITTKIFAVHAHEECITSV